jgi:hypothetical protein
LEQTKANIEIIGLGGMAKKTGKNEYRYKYWELNHNKIPTIFSVYILYHQNKPGSSLSQLYFGSKAVLNPRFKQIERLV